LRWSDLVFDETGGLLRVRAAVNKNRKKQCLPLHPELARALQAEKPADREADGVVLPNCVPKMKYFLRDLAKAGISFLNERGQRMDYHALRTTFTTRLSLMKVHPRVAMELGRHSDLRLTMKTYTDCGQLPLPEVMESLPGFGKAADSRIDSQTLVAGGQFVSPSVIGLKPIKVGKTVGNIDANHEASPAVTVGHTNENGGERGIRTPGTV